MTFTNETIGEFSYQDLPACKLEHYLITRSQVGTGRDSVTPASTTVALGNPLTETEYGSVLRSIFTVTGDLYKTETEIIDRQTFIQIRTQGVVDNSLVSVWVLDEETANGQTINEAGLFVHNPYLAKKTEQEISIPAPDITLLGRSTSTERTPNTTTSNSLYQPGHFLAAYKQFTNIYKERYFSLLFRWSITFE